MHVVVDGLADPFQIVWGPDDCLWVTERTAGRITRVRASDGAKSAAITIAGVLGDSGNGLLGMALDPGLLKGAGNEVDESKTWKCVRFKLDFRVKLFGVRSDELSPAS